MRIARIGKDRRLRIMERLKQKLKLGNKAREEPPLGGTPSEVVAEGTPAAPAVLAEIIPPVRELRAIREINLRFRREGILRRLLDILIRSLRALRIAVMTIHLVRLVIRIMVEVMEVLIRPHRHLPVPVRLTRKVA